MRLAAAGSCSAHFQKLGGMKSAATTEMQQQQLLSIQLWNQ
jgi:hypothetical protein